LIELAFLCNLIGLEFEVNETDRQIIIIEEGALESEIRLYAMRASGGNKLTGTVTLPSSTQSFSLLRE
jgi:hypothetical protein